jgi:hypothetical protein
MFGYQTWGHRNLRALLASAHEVTAGFRIGYGMMSAPLTPAPAAGGVEDADPAE